MRIFINLSVFATLAVSMYALNPNRQVSQYGHNAWRLEDGFFPSAPRAIAQTADGYIWIGMQNGLVRFDGIRFTPWVAPPGQELPAPEIISLQAAHDGGLWIGTARGLALWKEQKLARFGDGGRINAILEDRGGTVWVARSRVTALKTGALCRVQRADLECYDKPNGIPIDRGEGASALGRDPSGGIWVGSVAGVFHWPLRPASSYFPAALRKNNGNGAVAAIQMEADGSLYVGLGQTGPGGGLQKIVSGVWSEYTVRQMQGSALAVRSFLKDRDGGVWIGTWAHGIYHMFADSVDKFTHADGLSSDTVENLFQDREGNVWAVTVHGLDRFRDLSVASVGKRQGLSGDQTESILASSIGEVWAGNGSILDSFRYRGGFEFTRTKMPGSQTSSIVEDHSGRIWVGVDKSLVIKEGNHFQQIRRPDGTDLGVVFAMIEGPENDVYAVVTGNPQILFRIHDRKVVESVVVPRMIGAPLAADLKNGVWLGFTDGSFASYHAGKLQIVAKADPSFSTQYILVDKDGSIWSAGRYGLGLWKAGSRRLLTSRNGLPCDEIYSAVRDDSKRLWIYAGCGAAVIADAELQRWWRQPETTIAMRVFDAVDGAQTGASPFEPVVSKAPDGTLWFTNDQTVQYIDPNRLTQNTVPPPVFVEQVVANGKSYAAQADLALPKQIRSLQIDYTALSFVAPQKVRFRYKLEGLDETWQEAGARRQAFYTDVPPKSYRFRVIACNNDGVWNEAGAVWTFSVAPAYYQTIWFRTVCVLAGGAMLGLLYRRHVREVTQRLNLRMEERVQERTRIARELHDTLLQSFQGALMKIAAVTYMVPYRPDEAQKKLEAAVEEARLAVTEGRDAVQGLRNSTVLSNDLAYAIGAVGKELNSQYGEACPAFYITVDGESRNLLPIIRDEIYRIACEAVRNSFAHAQASRIEVRIQYEPRQFRLLIRDNGKGIDSQVLDAGSRAGHHGLPGMSERAILVGGTLEIRSQLNSGTEIELTIPASHAYAKSPRRHLGELAGKGN